MTRSPRRIARTLQIIKNYWLQVPDWRFGQLIENVKRFSGKEDLFYVEDQDLIYIFEDFFKAYQNDTYIRTTK